MEVDSILDKFNSYKNIRSNNLESSLNQLSLYSLWAVGDIENCDLYILAKLLSDEDFHKLIDYYDGGLVKLPTKKQKDTGLLIGQCLYMRESLGYSWKQIEQFYKNNNITVDLGAIKTKVKKVLQKLNTDIGKLLYG